MMTSYYKHLHVLTGSVIKKHSLYAYMTTHGFVHTLWLSESEFEFLKSSYLPNKGIIDLSFSGPLFTFQSNDSMAVKYINIQQLSHPWAVFEYYLYHRQIREDGSSFTILNQIAAYKAAEKHSFRENYWITENFIWYIEYRPADFPESYTPVQFLCDRAVRHRRDVYYNIYEFKESRKMKTIIQNRIYSAQSAHLYPWFISKQLLAAMFSRGYQSRLWFRSSEIHFAHTLEVRLKENEDPVRVWYDSTTCHSFYNIEQTTHPLRLQKFFCNNRVVRSTCVDVLSKQALPMGMAQKVISWKRSRNLTSRYWIREHDLALVNAILKERMKNGFYFNGMVFFNIDQFENPNEVWKSIDALRFQRNKKQELDRSLDILDRLLAD